MPVRTALLPILSMLLSSPCLLQGQETFPVPRGARVRLVYQVSEEDGVAMAEGTLWGTAMGRLMGIGPDRLFVVDEGSRATISVPRSGLRSLEVQSGTKRATMLGAVIGGLSGIAFFSLISTGLPNCTPGTKNVGGWTFTSTCIDKSKLVFGGGVLGAVVGAVAGGSHKTPLWAEVPLESIGVFVAPGGRTGFGLSIPLGR
jgi:hypothetical protein